MKLSVFYHHIREAANQTGKNIEEILSAVRSFGIEYAETDIADISGSDEVYEKLCRAGMKISSIYGFYDFGNKPDGSAGFSHIDKAAEYGAEKIMIVPGFYTSCEEKIKNKQRENMLEAMSEMCAYAENKGIVPTVEDFDDFNSPVSTAEGMLWFIKRIPALKATFDTGNFMYSAQGEIYAFELLKNYIVHVHCKDRSMTPDSDSEMKISISGTEMYDCPAGFGCVPISGIVKLLENNGYDGIYTIEHFGAGNQLEFIRQSAENLKGMTVS